MAVPATARPSTGGVPGHVLALAGLAGTAGVIHLVATIQHVTDERILGVFFALVGAAQLTVAWRVYHHPDDARTLKAAAAASVAVALLWVFSRTTGLPFGPEPGKVSAVGAADSIATAQELAFAAIAAMLLRGHRASPRLGWLDSGLGTRLTTALLSASLFIAAIGGHEH